MKLLMCKSCGEIFSLSLVWKKCSCKQCGGRYKNVLDAEYEGNCVPLGFENRSFNKALKNQPETGSGERFTAFVIPKECPTMNNTSLVRKK